MACADKGKGFVTRSIPPRGISLPFGLRSPLKRNHARSALTGDSSPHALYPAGIYNRGRLSIMKINGASATPELL